MTENAERKEIILPRFVSERCSYALMERLKTVSESEEVVILNASNVTGITPCGIILLADFAYKRLVSNKRVQIEMPTHPDPAEYIRNSGLLRITQATNLSDAIDINNVQLRLLDAMEPMVPEMLSGFVTGQAQNVGDDEKYLLRMWITELLTNANDHAISTSGFWVCGRYNKISKDIRICVADSGIGIKQSLVNAGKLSPTISDDKAIEKALEEGITSRVGKTGGLGLKHISSYVKSHGGSMTILSGTGKAYLARRTKRIKHGHQKYQGTIVSVMFNTETISRNGKSPIEKTPFIFE